MKQKNLDFIEQLLAEWNPINVPHFIRKDEYKSYAYEIIKKYKTKDEIYKYLVNVFTNDMGYNLTKESDLEIEILSSEISIYIGN